MRKMCFILLAFAICLLFRAGGLDMRAGDARETPVVLSVDRAQDDALRCERLYNANLNLVRVVTGVASPASAPAFQRGQWGAGALSDRFAAGRHGSGTTQATSAFDSSDLSVGVCAVDYYVYRLRRLLI